MNVSYDSGLNCLSLLKIRLYVQLQFHYIINLFVQFVLFTGSLSNKIADSLETTLLVVLVVLVVDWFLDWDNMNWLHLMMDWSAAVNV